MLFKPTYVFNNVTEITVDFLNKHNIKGLLLDLDNTLTTHNNPVPPQSSLDWLEEKESGIKMMIVSNNSSEEFNRLPRHLDFILCQMEKNR